MRASLKKLDGVTRTVQSNLKWNLCSRLVTPSLQSDNGVGLPTIPQTHLHVTRLTLLTPHKPHRQTLQKLPQIPSSSDSHPAISSAMSTTASDGLTMLLPECKLESIERNKSSMSGDGDLANLQCRLSTLFLNIHTSLQQTKIRRHSHPNPDLRGVGSAGQRGSDGEEQMSGNATRPREAFYRSILDKTL